MEPFVPRPSLAGGHKMTLYSWGNPRYFPSLPRASRRYFDVDAESRVAADCHWQAEPWNHPTLVALHVIHELTQIDRLPSLAVAGYSLGGNVALKLAAEYGTHPPPALHAVAAVSPIIEIGDCVRALEQPRNALYQWNFVKDLKRRMRRKERIRPGHFDLSKLAAVRTVREFDEIYTAPYFGFRSADDYYHRASSIRIIDRIAIPALVITAEDDPFVPSQPFHDPKLSGNRYIDLRICEHGGHCGFVGTSSAADDGYWAEHQIVEFVERHSSGIVKD